MDKFRPRRACTLAFKGTNTGIFQKLTQTNIFGLPGFGDESCRKKVFRMVREGSRRTWNYQRAPCQASKKRQEYRKPQWRKMFMKGIKMQ